MNTSIASSTRPSHVIAKYTRLWFVVAFIGQLLFAIYILLQYVLNGVLGNIEAWNETSTGGYTPGDKMGNIAFGVHIVLAAIITIGGPLQLIPKIRERYRRFHRVNGRVYIIAAYIISIAGLYLIWVRGTVGDTTAHVMTSINGLIIIVAATYTIKNAMLKHFEKHQKWAIRLFLAMSGVYFFRVLLNCWLILFQDLGIDFDSFTGPALTVIGFSAYIGPQLAAEYYFKVIQNDHTWGKQIMTAFLGLIILVFMIGTIGAAVFMWLPRLL